MRSLLIGLASVAVTLLSPAASAFAASDVSAPVYDPWEKANRALYKFNDGLDRAVLRPAALGYKRAVPRPVRHGVRNVINNINEPNTLLNDLLQGRVDRGGVSAFRFLINSTIGVAGVFEVAAPLGLPPHDADFGQTLGRWGVPPGPYLYVPVFGPSDLRDGSGRIVDGYASILSLPSLNLTTWDRVGVSAVDGVDTRLALDPTIEEIRRTATDPYATERSAYLQYRRSRVTDGKQAVDQLPSFDAPPPAAAH